MRSPNHPTRREFTRLTGLAAGAAALGMGPTGRTDPGDRGRTPDAPEVALARLIEGNARFAEGRPTHPGRTPADFAALAEGQSPLAVIVGCADSRVPPEVLFDQGVGDLFVVRVAGNIISGGGAVVKGSIEYAVAELGVRLIMVLGHGQCGAVKAAIEHIDAHHDLPGAIGGLIAPIRPAVRAVTGQPGDLLANVIKANVAAGVKRLEGLDPIVAPLVRSKELKVVGAVYELRTGKVGLIA